MALKSSTANQQQAPTLNTENITESREMKKWLTVSRISTVDWKNKTYFSIPVGTFCKTKWVRSTRKGVTYRARKRNGNSFVKTFAFPKSGSVGTACCQLQKFTIHFRSCVASFSLQLWLLSLPYSKCGWRVCRDNVQIPATSSKRIDYNTTLIKQKYGKILPVILLRENVPEDRVE